jgi:hypothetical protein
MYGTTQRGEAQRGTNSVQSTLSPPPPRVTEFLGLLLPFKVSISAALLHFEHLSFFQLSSRSRQSPSYKFSDAEISMLLDTLEAHHLTFSLSLRGVGEAWKAVNDQITTSLSLNGIILAPHQSSGDPGCWSPRPSGFTSSPISSLTPCRHGDRAQLLFRQTEITAINFTVSTLERLSTLVDNPRRDDSRPILFFGVCGDAGINEYLI